MEPTWIFAHGLAGLGSEFEAFIFQLQQRGLATARIAPDLVGHGDNLASKLSTVEDVLRQVPTDGPVVVVGQSMGGIVAMHVAEALGDRVVACIVIEAGIDPRSEDDVEGTRSAVSNIETPAFELDVIMSEFASLVTADRGECWSGLTCPVLLVFGSDGWIDAQDQQQMIDRQPSATVVTIAEAAHDVHLDQPAALADACAEFLGTLR